MGLFYKNDSPCNVPFSKKGKEIVRRFGLKRIVEEIRKQRNNERIQEES